MVDKHNAGSVPRLIDYLWQCANTFVALCVVINFRFLCSLLLHPVTSLNQCISGIIDDNTTIIRSAGDFYS